MTKNELVVLFGGLIDRLFRYSVRATIGWFVLVLLTTLSTGNNSEATIVTTVVAGVNIAIAGFMYVVRDYVRDLLSAEVVDASTEVESV